MTALRTMYTNLHSSLIKLQSTGELKRKANRALRKDIWTVEDIDYADRAGKELEEYFAQDA